MKILERKDWAKEFSFKCTCPQCESVLLIEADDLRHKPGGGDMRESWPEEFNAQCAVCAQAILVPTTSIPKYVQKLARDRSSRSNTGYFDR